MRMKVSVVCCIICETALCLCKEKGGQGNVSKKKKTRHFTTTSFSSARRDLQWRTSQKAKRWSWKTHSNPPYHVYDFTTPPGHRYQAPISLYFFTRYAGQQGG